MGMAGGADGRGHSVHRAGSTGAYQTALGRKTLDGVAGGDERLPSHCDAIDRTYSQPLDIRALASVASVSEAHFIRTFGATFGETPHRYLQRRRVERAMFLLRETERSITDICLDVGFASLGTFSRTFRDIVGVNPTDYRERGEVIHAPTCFTMAWMRPSSFGEAPSQNGK